MVTPRHVAKSRSPWQTCRMTVHRSAPGPRFLGLFLVLLTFVAAAGSCSPAAPGAEFIMRLPDLERTWIGPDYYGNRLQDWRLASGRVEATTGASTRSMRTLQLLSYALAEEPGRLEMSVRTGPIEPGGTAHENTWTGFLIGAGGDHVDYRISAMVHDWPAPDGGLIVAVDGTGKVVMRDNSTIDSPKSVRANVSTSVEAWPVTDPASIDLAEGAFEDVVLTLVAEPMPAAGDGEAAYRIEVSVRDGESGADLGGAAYENVPAEYLSGNVGLVSHNSRHTQENPALAQRQPRVFESDVITTGPGYWFRDWTVSGTKVEHHPDRVFGPVMGAMHTLSAGTLKMTAQMGPLGADDNRTGELQIQRNGRWETVDSGELIDLSYTMPFRVDDWDASVDTPYRIVYDLRIGGFNADMTQNYTYEGTIRAEPQRNDFVLASMNCQHFSARPDRDSSARGYWNSSGIWFPHADVADAVEYHDPDMLYFSGDQIYEGGLAGIVREPYDEAALDYLYHWYWFVWSFRDLMRDIPTIATPDDHDVYQGNIWGAGGTRGEAREGISAQDRGGYTMDPRWVNAVHQTQTSHHPDPPDPTPIDMGISVWYSTVDYSGVSMAVVSDRMFKSAPALAVEGGEVRNGWFQNPRFDPATRGDVADAVLLGERQLDFLDDWAQDWSGGVWMKVLLSQTLFSNLATLPADAASGAVLPNLPVAGPDEFVSGDRKAADADSGGWPQSGRNRALRAMRKAFAPHIAGDQHLGSTIQYGIDNFGDGPYAFVVPAVANLWPRRWYPPEAGANRAAGAPPYTGDHLDGFGNRMTVLAVANPIQSGVEPSALYDRVPGYGIIRFDKLSRDIVFESWPRWVDPSQPGAEQYYGWPVTFHQLDNFGGEVGYLATVDVTGLQDPVIQLIDEGSGEVVYTVRIAGTTFRAKVFDADKTYTLVVSEPDSGQTQRLTGLTVAGANDTVEVIF